MVLAEPHAVAVVAGLVGAESSGCVGRRLVWLWAPR